MEFLKAFDLSLWWRALIAVGVVILVAGVAKGDRAIVIIAAGIIAFGFGEWLNRPKVGIVEGGWMKTWYEWRPCTSGLFLDVIGICLMAWGGYRLLFW